MMADADPGVVVVREHADGDTTRLARPSNLKHLVALQGNIPKSTWMIPKHIIPK
jgi:hypothetical protein